jgi:hypothetical protein
MPTVLSIAAVVFWLAAAVREVHGSRFSLELTTGQQRLLGVSGAVLLGLATALYSLPFLIDSGPSPTPTPVSTGTPSPAPTTTATAWPTAEHTAALTPTPALVEVGNLVQRFTSETLADAWENLLQWDEDWRTCQLTGKAQAASDAMQRGSAYQLALKAGQWSNYSVRCKRPLMADIIVAHFYLPESSDIEDNWVAVGAVDEHGWLAYSKSRIPLGEWTALVLDLRGQYDDSDQPLSRRPVVIQAAFAVEAKEGATLEGIVAGLDDVRCYALSGQQDVREQRGAGRRLFDFEEGLLDGWQVVEARAGTDTLTVSSETVHRGRYATGLETRLESAGGVDEQTSLHRAWDGDSSPVGFLAQVLVPGEAPSATKLWARLLIGSQERTVTGGLVSLERGTWTTVGLFLSRMSKQQRQTDWGDGQIWLEIQFETEGVPYQGPIYIDDIQVFYN